MRLLAFLSGVALLLSAGCTAPAGGPSRPAAAVVLRYVDLTHDLSSESVFWPTGETFQLTKVADGVTVSYGMTASDIGTDLMQALKDIADFDAGGSGNFNAANTLNAAQNTFLSNAIAQVTTASTNLNATTASNGYVSNRLTDAQSQQDSLNTVYKKFTSDIQDTNMAEAATRLSLNQTQLQAALQVTAGLHQLSLLNYLPISGS